MELPNKKQSDVSHSHREENTSLNDFFPQEGIMDARTIATIPEGLLFRPHNYRRKLEVKPQSDSGVCYVKKYYPLTSISKKHILTIKLTKNVTIQYGKNSLIAIYKQNVVGGHKETYHIQRNSINEINGVIDKKKDKIMKKLDKALLSFASKFKISLPMKRPTWNRQENWIKGESFIDSIPRETIVHDTYFKKVYGEGIEFVSGKDKDSTVYLKNFIKNRAIEDISPQIASEIRNLNYTTSKLLYDFALQIKLHRGVEMTKLKLLKKFEEHLTQKKMREYL